ncbi:MAG: YihY/virulence factor BrkB family protein [Caldilineaceae bacterium]
MSGAPTELPTIGNLLRMTFEKWYTDNIPRHAAALAYYTLFAVAPLLLLAVEIMGLINGQDVAEEQVVQQVEHYVNSPETAALVRTILNNALPSTASWWVTVAVVLALLYGASSVFGELQIVLNLIWGAPLYRRSDIWGVLFGRLLAVLMVIIGGLLIFFALVVTGWYTLANDWATNYVNPDSSYAEWSYFFILFLLLTAIFALIYKFVPNLTIAWHDVFIGAVATAFLISVARLLISWYLSHSRVSTMFGAASSLVILLLWVYYSAQIFFLGAEFTNIYSQTYGIWWRTGALPQFDQTEEEYESTAEEDDTETPEIMIYTAPEPETTAPVEIEVTNEQPLEQNGTLTDAARKATAAGRKATKASQKMVATAREQVHTVRSRLLQIVRLPLTLTRPLREVIVAVGVIGALSLAALFGWPWRKRREEEPGSE